MPERNLWVETCAAIEIDVPVLGERMADQIERALKERGGLPIPDLFSMDDMRTIAHACMIVKKLTYAIQHADSEGNPQVFMQQMLTIMKWESTFNDLADFIAGLAAAKGLIPDIEEDDDDGE